MYSSVILVTYVCGFVLAVLGSRDGHNDVDGTMDRVANWNGSSNHPIFRHAEENKKQSQNYKPCRDYYRVPNKGMMPCQPGTPVKSIQYIYQYPIYQYPVYEYATMSPLPVYKPVVYKYPTMAPFKPLTLPTMAPVKAPAKVNYNTWNYSLKIPIYAPMKFVAVPAYKPLPVPTWAPIKSATFAPYKPYVFPPLKPLSTFGPLKPIQLPTYKPIVLPSLAPVKSVAFKPLVLPALKPWPTYAPIKSWTYAPSKSLPAVLPNYGHKTSDINYALLSQNKQQFLALPHNAAPTRIQNVGNDHTTNNFTFIVINNCGKTPTDVKCRVPVQSSNAKKTANQIVYDVDFTDKEFDKAMELLLNQNLVVDNIKTYSSENHVSHDKKKPQHLKSQIVVDSLQEKDPATDLVFDPSASLNSSNAYISFDGNSFDSEASASSIENRDEDMTAANNSTNDSDLDSFVVVDNTLNLNGTTFWMYEPSNVADAGTEYFISNDNSTTNDSGATRNAGILPNSELILSDLDL